MNKCMPLNSVECTTNKMDIFKEITNAKMKNNADVKKVVSEIRSEYEASIDVCDK